MVPNVPSRYGSATIPKKPKIKIEFTDGNGGNYSLSAEGMSRENLLKMIDFVQGLSDKQEQFESQQQELVDTNFARVFNIIEEKFPFGSFTSVDLLNAYQQHFQLETNLSTMSTYLARLTQRGFLVRTRHGAGWFYKLTHTQEQTKITTSEVTLSTKPDLLTP